MKRGVLYLVIGVPLSAVIMGVLILYLALSNPDPGVRYDGPPLSKTSHRNPE